MVFLKTNLNPFFRYLKTIYSIPFSQLGLFKNDWIKCTSDEVCIFACEVVLCLKVNFSESDERKDGDVVSDADQTDEPKTGRKDQNVAKVNLKRN